MPVSSRRLTVVDRDVGCRDVSEICVAFPIGCSSHGHARCSAGSLVEGARSVASADVHPKDHHSMAKQHCSDEQLLRSIEDLRLFHRTVLPPWVLAWYPGMRDS